MEHEHELKQNNPWRKTSLDKLLCETLNEYCSHDNYGTGRRANNLKKFTDGFQYQQNMDHEHELTQINSWRKTS